jgi:Xaa-Pro aminopeptidase
MTVEPGLYYPRWGGIRLEDLVVVTKTGCRNMTRFAKQLEL